MVSPSRPSCGQNHISSPTQARHIATAATRAGDVATASPAGPARPESTSAPTETPPAPNEGRRPPRDRQQPVAGGREHQRRHQPAPLPDDRMRTAAAANSSAIDALNAGCGSSARSARSRRGAQRDHGQKHAVGRPAQPAATQAPATKRGTYGVPMPSLDRQPTIPPSTPSCRRYWMRFRSGYPSTTESRRLAGGCAICRAGRCTPNCGSRTAPSTGRRARSASGSIGRQRSDRARGSRRR